MFCHDSARRALGGCPPAGGGTAIRRWSGTCRRRTGTVGGPGIDLFEAVFRKSADCIKLLDIEGRILLLNAGGVATMELDDPQALIGRNWIDFWSGTERDAACAAIQTACGGGVGRFRGSLPTAKGTPKNWDTVITPLRSGSGPVARLVAVSRDVTEQETLRTELDAARRRNQAIVLATSEIVWQADASQQTGSGTGLAAFSGVAENAGTRADWLALIHPEERDGIDALSRDAVLQGTGYVSEYRLRHHSGGYRWVEDRVVPLRDRHGDLVEWVGVISDIDARVTAHRALREGEERLRLAIRASHVGIWDIDLVTGTRRWSEEAKAILGLPADATESRELFLGLIDPEDRPRVQETFDADCTLSRGLTFRFRRHDTGVQRWLTVSGKTVLDGNRPAGAPHRHLPGRDRAQDHRPEALGGGQSGSADRAAQPQPVRHQPGGGDPHGRARGNARRSDPGRSRPFQGRERYARGTMPATSCCERSRGA